MKTEERFKNFIEYFSKSMPVAETELHYTNAYELIVAVILSAQCTDKRVNMVTPAFFNDFPNPESLAVASVENIFEKIKSISYPNNKAKNLKAMAQMLHNVYKDILPSDPEELQKLPGVGRKTAHVLASVLYNKQVLAVDTHVFRVSERIGLTTKAKNPLDCEKQLIKHLDLDLLVIAHHWLILHGRYVCIARKPKCTECGAKHFCRYYEKTKATSGAAFEN